MVICVNQQAASLVVGAQQLIKIKDTTGANQWLLEARSLIRKGDPDETSVHVAFGIVSTFGKSDRITAFEVLAEAVRQMGKTSIGPADEDRVPLLKRFPDLNQQQTSLKLNRAGGTILSKA